MSPVPAGMGCPTTRCSFSPRSTSTFPGTDATVSTRGVKRKDTVDTNESVSSEALEMPIRSGRPEAPKPLSSTTLELVLQNSNKAQGSVPLPLLFGGDATVASTFKGCRYPARAYCGGRFLEPRRATGSDGIILALDAVCNGDSREVSTWARHVK